METAMQDTGKRENIRLLCLDLDGTLLNDDKEIDPRDVEEIRRAAADGVTIALITGRMPAATDETVRKLRIPCILACNAGTYILEKGTCIYSEYLPLEAMRKVYGVIESYQLPMWIFRHEDWMVTDLDAAVEKEIRTIRYMPRIINYEKLEKEWALMQTAPNKLLVGTNPSKVQEIYGILQDMKIPGIEMACSAPEFLEIYPEGMDKGKALSIICREKEIPLEETMAFGDQELDIPMIRQAHIGIAMENGISGLKQIAQFVTKSNNEAGIAYGIAKYLTGTETSESR